METHLSVLLSLQRHSAEINAVAVVKEDTMANIHINLAGYRDRKCVCGFFMLSFVLRKPLCYSQVHREPPVNSRFLKSFPDFLLHVVFGRIIHWHV